MYQGAITNEHGATGDDWPRMRSLDWTDLVTRLSALNDLRSEVDGRKIAKQLHGRFVSLGNAEATEAVLHDNAEDRYLPVNHDHSMAGKDDALNQANELEAAQSARGLGTDRQEATENTQ